MDGLETIALAVAHLESLQPDGDSDRPPPTNVLSDAGCAVNSKAVPYPRLHGRMVSDDSIEPVNSKELVSSLEEPPTSGIPVHTMHHPGYYQHWYASGAYQPVPVQRNSSTIQAPAPSAADLSAQEEQIRVHTSGPVADLLHKVSLVTDNLDNFFTLMTGLERLALSDNNKPADIPKPDEALVQVQVQRHDVLLGRGGETNHHLGNIQYRMLVKACQPAYLAAKRRDKPRIAAAIVTVVRARSGRFLKKHASDNAWRDVGNIRAREKTSQALREGAPELRGTVEASRAQLLTEAVEGSLAKKMQRPMCESRGKQLKAKSQMPTNGSDSNETEQVPEKAERKHLSSTTESSPHVMQSSLIPSNGRHHYPLHYHVPIPMINGPVYYHHGHPHGAVVYHPPPVALDGRYHHTYPDKRLMTTASSSEPPKKRQSLTEATSHVGDARAASCLESESAQQYNHTSSSNDCVTEKSTVSATVSAEHSEEEIAQVRTASPTSSTSSSKNAASRGPRIKLLKERLDDATLQA
jgi:hypothetical protein